MSPTSLLQPGDCHTFESAGQRFLYLAPSAAVVAVDDVSAAILDLVSERTRTAGDVVSELDGPNPQRSGNRNNVGDVWVVAVHTPTGGAPMRARAHLVVTVPLYMRWDFSTVGGR